MTERICEGLMCDKPSGDGTICRECLGKLRKLLAEIPALFDELDVAILKEARFAVSADKVTQKGNHQPLPFDVTAAAARDELDSRLTLWVADVAKDDAVEQRAAISSVWASAWLLAGVERVRTFEAAGDLCEELFSARATAVYAIDRPMERRYLGECEFRFIDESDEVYPVCGATLWGRDGEDELKCKDCGTGYLVGILEQKIQDVAGKGMEDRIYTASEAAELIVALRLTDHQDPARLVRQIGMWAGRNRLVRKIDLEKHGHKRPGYRLGDILGLVNASPVRKAS